MGPSSQFAFRIAYGGVGLLPSPLVVRGKGGIVYEDEIGDEFKAGEVEADDEFEDFSTGSSPSC